MQSLLAHIFCIGLPRLSIGTFQATASTAVVSHLERLWRTFVWFGNVWKAFLSWLKRKRIVINLRFLGRKESKLEPKNSKKFPKLFYSMVFTVYFFSKSNLNVLLTCSERMKNCVNACCLKIAFTTKTFFIYCLRCGSLSEEIFLLIWEKFNVCLYVVL